jgi:hypothetical protein
VQAEAQRRGLGRAQKIYLVMDGAVWLWELAEDRFAEAIKTLDFHHARDHLWALAHALHGQDTPEAKAWVQPLLRSLRKGGEARVVRRLEELLEKGASPNGAQELIEREVTIFWVIASICTIRRWSKRARLGAAVQWNRWANSCSDACAAAARFGAVEASPIYFASACSSKTKTNHSSGIEKLPTTSGCTGNH